MINLKFDLHSMIDLNLDPLQRIARLKSLLGTPWLRHVWISIAWVP
jgi:hypothetical protein